MRVGTDYVLGQASTLSLNTAARRETFKRGHAGSARVSAFKADQVQSRPISNATQFDIQLDTEFEDDNSETDYEDQYGYDAETPSPRTSLISVSLPRLQLCTSSNLSTGWPNKSNHLVVV